MESIKKLLFNEIVWNAFRNYWNFTHIDFIAIKSKIKYLLDLDFSENIPITLSTIPVTIPITLLSKTDYLLEAPSGRRLCAVSKSKAEWYLEERLGEKLQSEAFTIRLYNDPFAEDNSYWQTSNQYECVVCGEKDAFVCKEVVPREYRMHFPCNVTSFELFDSLLTFN